MELSEAIARRQMTRSFSDTKVPKALLDQVLAAGQRAPSAGFSQGVDLLCVKESEGRRRFWDLASDPTWRSAEGRANELMAAPVIVLPLCDPSAYVARYAEPDKERSSLSGLSPQHWPVPYWMVDASFTVMLILLGATEAGLGSLFFRLHGDEQALLDEFGVPSGVRAIGAIALGFPAVPPAASRARRKRRDFDAFVHSEQW